MNNEHGKYDDNHEQCDFTLQEGSIRPIPEPERASAPP